MLISSIFLISLISLQGRSCVKGRRPVGKA